LLYTSAAFTAPAANREVTATATNLSFILNNPYNFLLGVIPKPLLNEGVRQWRTIFK
jgi:hypothetical protein